MATKANRAATGGNKKGGDNKRRNWAVRLLRLDKRLDRSENQEAFSKGRLETVVRHRNVTSQEPSHRTFAVKIPTLASHSEIPEQYTGIGSNISPPLRWGPPPAGTEELALICEDLDSPGDTPFVHWLVYRIPATVTELPEDVSKADQIKEMPGVPLQGVNSQGGLGYTGPNPPLADDSWHHYRFRLFALEAPLRNLRPGMTREELWDQIKNHLLQDSELVARFHRKPVTQRLRKSA